MTQVDQAEITTLLSQEWDLIAELCATLTDEQWQSPTDCPGWSVKDQLSHIIGTEKMLLGDPLPDIDIGEPSHIKNDIAKGNEKWIAERRDWPTQQLLAEFSEVTAQRVAALEAMTQDDFDAPSWTPAGEDTYGRFMLIRLFDCWTHEQDIRYAIRQPGHDTGEIVAEVLAETSRAIAFVVGKLGGAPAGSRIEFQLAQAEAQPAMLRVERPSEDSRAALVAEFSDQAEATAVIAMDLMLFFRLTGGRESAAAAIEAGRVSLSGDTAVGHQIATSLAYVF